MKRWILRYHFQKLPSSLYHEQVELRKAEVRWTRPRVRDRRAEMEAEAAKTEKLYRKFQGILNKLTPTKFQSLAEQALKLDISTEERLAGCIDRMYTSVRKIDSWLQIFIP